MLKSACTRNAKASSLLDPNELRDLQRASLVVMDSVDSFYEQFVQSDKEAPMLQIYCNDGTPTKVKCKMMTKVGTRRVTRSGGRCEELLVQVSFARRRVAGELVSAIRIADSRPLSFGKGAKQTFSETLRFHIPLRQYGHTGIVTEVLVFDRLLFSALSLLFMQWSFHRLFVLPMDAEQKKLLYLTEWTLPVPCGLHDAQNANKRSVLHLLSDPTLLKEKH